MHQTFHHTLRYGVAVAGFVLAGNVFAASGPSCVQPGYGAGLIPASNDEHLVIKANHANASFGQHGTSILSGAVQISQNGRVFSAPEVVYDGSTKQVKIAEPSVFSGPHFAIDSQSMSFDLGQQTGLFSNSKFVLPQQRSHGAARQLKLSTNGNAQLEGASYTTCAADHPSWLLSAQSIHLDQQEGLGTARNAILHFQGVPVLWLPWFRFPIDHRRRTGLLFPTIGHGSKTGFDFRIPLYINIAPNFDDTFTPRYMSRRGLLLGNEFRYLLPANEGSFVYQYLGHDRVAGHQRSFIDLQHQGLLADSLGLSVDFEQASDISYFDDFGGSYSGSALGNSSTAFLPRGASLTYHQGNSPTTVQLLAESYQPLAIIQNPNDRPYKRLPELRVQTLTRHSFHNLRAGFEGNLNNFERSHSLTGQRLYLNPYLSWDLDRTGWYLSSRLDGTWTRYHLSQSTLSGDRNPERALPMFSFNGGLRFNRHTSSGLLQTLEPHLFYLYVPYKNQTQLPIFDTGEPDFNFPALFARNHFTGEDRIADANHLTSVITTRLINPHTGLVKLSGSLGVIYRFRAPRVTLPGESRPSAGFSDYVGSFDYRYSRHWDTASQIQWSTRGNHVVRASSAIHYRSNSQQHVTLRYEYRQGLFNQADLSFVLPIKDNWHVAGRITYSLRNSKSLGAFGGLEYETCCWAIRAGARRYISNVSGHMSTGMFLQLTLKGLTSIGTGWDSLLPSRTRNVRGVVHR